jgi:nucleotide-binding universal stress UspA family protein
MYALTGPPDEMDAGFRSIAVAVDGSDHAAAALLIAIDMARRYDARLTVVAIAPITQAIVMPNEPMLPPIMPESTLPQFRVLVDAAVQQAQTAGLKAVDGICEEGPAVDGLLGFLESHPVDLLILGSRGLSAAKRILLGSVSSALVNRAPCPVLVVRPPPTPHSS